MMMMRRRITAAVAAAALLVAATGCETVIGTEVTAVAADEVSVTVSVTAEEAAAKAFRDNPEFADEVTDLFTARGATDVARSDDGSTVRWEASVPAASVTDAAGITGVTKIDVAEEGGAAIVTAAIGPPTQLRAALEGTEDELAVPLLLSQTVVELRVVGSSAKRTAGLTTAPATKLVVTTDDDAVSVRRPADSDATGEIVVRATPVSSSSALPWIVVGVGVVLAALLWVRRDKRPQPPDQRR